MRAVYGHDPDGNLLEILENYGENACAPLSGLRLLRNS